MPSWTYGPRIGREGRLIIGCTAIILDNTPNAQQVLLTQRRDNGQWCLPGGRMEAGESPAEACLREVAEETGLTGEVERLVGIYASPHRLLSYPDGNRYQLVDFGFAVRIVGGVLRASAETQGGRYTPLAQLGTLDIIQNHHEMIADALLGLPQTLLR